MHGGSDLSFIWNESIESLKEHFKEHFIEIEVGYVKRFGIRVEGTSFYLRDPDGSLLEFKKYANK
jgi:extradiol dioxygenase family protein